MSGASSVPAALDALVELAGRLTIPGLQIIDGDPLSLEADYLAVGWTGEPDGEAVTWTDRGADAARFQDRESYDVQHEIGVWDGDLSASDARRQAFAIHAAYLAAVADDPTLGDVVISARAAGGGLAPATDEGSLATIRFVVHIEGVTE